MHTFLKRREATCAISERKRIIREVTTNCARNMKRSNSNFIDDVDNTSVGHTVTEVSNMTIKV
jgi:hypothetical protein